MEPRTHVKAERSNRTAARESARVSAARRAARRRSSQLLERAIQGPVKKKQTHSAPQILPHVERSYEMCIKVQSHRHLLQIETVQAEIKRLQDAARSFELPFAIWARVSEERKAELLGILGQDGRAS